MNTGTSMVKLRTYNITTPRIGQINMLKHASNKNTYIFSLSAILFLFITILHL